MNRRMQVLVYAMIGLNLLLLLALVHINMSPATAQQQNLGRSDYAVSTGKIDDDTDGVFILDRGKQKITVVVMGQNGKLRQVAPSQVINPRKGQRP